MSAIYYDQGSDIKVKQCKTIVTFDTIPESKILDAGNVLILSNLQKPWTIACKDVSRVFEIEYSTYCICRASTRPPASSVNYASLPSRLDGIRNRKARTGLVRQSSLIELCPQNRTRPILAHKASANQRLSCH